MNVQRFLGVGTLPDKLDTTIELILTRTQSKKKHKHPEKESQYHYICKNIAFDYLNPADISDEYLLKLRIVRVEVSDGVFEKYYHYTFRRRLYTGRYKILLQSPLGHRNFFSRPKAYHWSY